MRSHGGHTARETPPARPGGPGERRAREETAAISTTRTVTRTIEFHLVSLDVDGDSSRITSVPVELSYHRGDPFAVHLRFVTGPRRHVDWVFARGLLADGLLVSCGDGDVRVFPGPVPQDDLVLVELDSPSGHARFEASATAVADFLDASYTSVAPGGEAQQVNLDEMLAALLTPGDS